MLPPLADAAVVTSPTDCRHCVRGSAPELSPDHVARFVTSPTPGSWPNAQPSTHANLPHNQYMPRSRAQISARQRSLHHPRIAAPVSLTCRLWIGSLHHPRWLWIGPLHRPQNLWTDTFHHPRKTGCLIGLSPTPPSQNPLPIKDLTRFLPP